MVEIIAVVVVTAILLGLGIVSYRGTRESALQRQAQSAATSYQQAIASFMLDHAGRPPQFGSQEWPSADRGPVNDLYRPGKPYMRSTPEPLQDGLVAWTGGNERARYVLSYEATASPPYRWTLTVREIDEGQDSRLFTCAVSNGELPEGVTAC